MLQNVKDAAWNENHTQSQSTFTLYLIRPYSHSVKQYYTYGTSTAHDQTTFSLSLYIYSHISHSSQSYGQQYSLVDYSKQYRISV